MVYITEIRMSDEGTRHEHIASVRWLNPETSETGESSREEMVDWIDQGEEVRVRDNEGHDVEVDSVHPKNSPAYIRSFADRVMTDNLLGLPEY